MLDVRLTRIAVEDGGLQLWGFPAVEGGAGSPGALAHMPGMRAGGNGTIVYLNCDDCAVRSARAEAAGGRLFKPKCSIGRHGYVSLVVDTEGNTVGLISTV